MALDDKTSQAVFKDYKRGHHVTQIAERYGTTTRQVNSVVKFESAVDARVKTALAKQSTKLAKPKTGAKPVSKTGGKSRGR